MNIEQEIRHAIWSQHDIPVPQRLALLQVLDGLKTSDEPLIGQKIPQTVNITATLKPLRSGRINCDTLTLKGD